MPNIDDRRLGGPPTYTPASPGGDVARTATHRDTPPKPPAGDGDGVEPARPPAVGDAKAEAPRKAVTSRIGTIGRRIALGAAVVGMAVGLTIGGSILMKQGEIQPQAPVAPIEQPVDVRGPSLPTGQDPPASETKPQEAPGGMPTAPGAMPTAPGARPQIDTDRVSTPPTFSPHTIRLDDVLRDR